MKFASLEKWGSPLACSWGVALSLELTRETACLLQDYPREVHSIIFCWLCKAFLKPLAAQ